MPTIKLNIIGPLPKEINRLTLERAAEIMSGSITDMASGTINLKLVDDVTIRALNKEYSGNDYSTDVLSFSYAQYEDGWPVANQKEIGDIAISLETATRQAAQAQTSLENEVALLLIHGIMHVWGLDHQSKAMQAEFDRIQQGVLEKLGLTYRNFQWDSSVV